jgi:potassium-transporting ATPase ATP-binding subunit
MSTSQISLSQSAETPPAIESPGFVSILVDAFAKLAPATQWKNPVMFVVYLGSILTTLLGVQALLG